MSTQSPTPQSRPSSTGNHAGHHHSSQGQSLEQALQQAGFYPRLVADVVDDALDGRECLSHLVHLETHFDRAEVRRHITVLVLTEDMLVITHVDDQQLDEAGEQIVAQISTESVPVAQIRSVVLSYMYSQPQNYKPSDPVRELTVSIAWSGGQRLDMGPASCGDPQCEADHGYSGTIAQEDIVLRISAEADGLQAVQDAKLFARALRAVNTGNPAPVQHSGIPAPRPRSGVFSSRLSRGHQR
ncbi:MULTISPECIES: DUF5998 family protein [Paenarthrobacter]|uniref:Cell wall biosynthesis glycosyltransferase n=1 Tax=Paenarthrobacter nicotinovorans TaxID=29320 RepID=A0ABT9TRP1_PAENI|nr:MULTISPECIES: DUF5998 family protein [Paenarthrobacter]KIA73513.1 hypothetical protein ANMWB30_17680 [Arthrobacter sp. MWB30]KQQ98104.1 hypothetical protein ASF74_15395 [Arthrobacter sp. Leaf145]SKB58082.1 hypothetical protein SAMN05660916_01640 [Arthrobacter sp. 31Cvi3.1E]BCW10419.1 hypothetical protein NtRootA2_17010 [Arthrobacter sp. NtRootA2]BCW14499.1 hypothetical protein NtRootA4_14780 [Arthrobacter sp. NtRootA4]BCW22834.1 hypothetical protein NtRootC7_17010 [Arthrobacter sp. NtRootC